MRNGGRLTLRRLVASVAAVIVVATGLTGLSASVAPTPASTAADLSQFQPGNIISDSLFFDSNAMTVSEIQAFLNSKVSNCASGYTCLKDYRETTYTVQGNPMCHTYQGAANESAATIIWKVAQACGISPKAILVILQKEQSLVTTTAPSRGRYESAMGAGCPDTAACDTQYYGFYNQVRYGSYLLKRYTQPPGTGPGTAWDSRYDLVKPVGTYTNVLYNPNGNCGQKTVWMANQATHSLYLYTPYTPNAAALAAGYGTGDSCSSYGNRNFFQFYTDWFGNTQGAVPASSANPIVAGTPNTGSTLTVSSGTWNGSPTPAISYSWYSCPAAVTAVVATVPANCAVIPSATSSTYVVAPSDAGKYITAAVTAKNNAGSASRWAVSTAAITGAAYNTVAPAITGSAAIGSELTSSAGTWSGSPAPTLTYSWYRCLNAVTTAATTAPAGCAVIAGASAATYTPTTADAGRFLAAAVTGTNTIAASTKWTPTTGVIGVAPVATGDPFITGTAAVGSTLSGSNGTWTGLPTGIQPPSGPNAGRTYNGYNIMVIQSSLNAVGISTTVDGIYGPQTTSNVRVYQSRYGLTVDGIVGPQTWGHMSSVVNAPATFVYAWYSCSAAVTASSTSQPAGCAPIAGAAAASFAVNAAQAGKFVSFAVTAKNIAGAATKWSVSTVGVAGTPANDVAPGVAGDTTVGNTLTTSDGTWSGAPAPTLTYGWALCSAAVATPSTTLAANCSVIPGATAATWAITADAVGKFVVGAVTATNSLGATTVWTASTAAVNAAPVATAPSVTGDPAVSGDAIVGATLTATAGAWSGTPAPSTTSAWYVCSAQVAAASSTPPAGCQAIGGATSQSYAPVAGDVDKYILVGVTATNSAGSATRWTASTTAVMAATVPPAPTGEPSITGTASVGSTLTGSAGTWTGPTATTPTPFVPSGPNSTRTYQGYNVMQIQWSLTQVGIPTDIDGIYGSQTTANVRQYQAANGLVVDGIVGPATWAHLSSRTPATTPTTTTSAWYTCTTAVAAVASSAPAGCTAIAGATATTYVLAASDAGQFVSYAVTISNSGGTETRWTASTAAVAP